MAHRNTLLLGLFLGLALYAWCSEGHAAPGSADEALFADQSKHQEPTAERSALPLVALPHDLGFHEVVKRWGAPRERKEMESKRETVWEYDNHTVFFKEGKVVAWTTHANGAVSYPAEKSVHATDHSNKSNTDDETIRSILGEILESPSMRDNTADTNIPAAPPIGMVPPAVELSEPIH